MPSAEPDVDEPMANESEDYQQLGPIPNLPEEIVVSILQWLPVRKLIQLEWISPVVIRNSFTEAKKKVLDLSQFAKWPKNWRNTTVGEDNIDGFNIFKKLLDLMGSQLTSVSLMCADSRLGPEELQLLATKCPLLSHLDLTGVAVDPSALRQLGVQLGRLESLVVRYSRDWERDTFGIAVASMTNLKHLDVSGNQLPRGGDCLSLLPPTVTSVRLRFAVFWNQADLEKFLRTHPGLKKFRLTTDINSIQDVPNWLAQYCPGLTHLSLRVYGSDGDLAVSFVNVFPSLPDLKELEVGKGILDCQTAAADMRSLCANCPDLEVLKLSHECSICFQPDDSSLPKAIIQHVQQLKKLRRLEIPAIELTGLSVEQLCKGVAATLEHFHLQPLSLDECSLGAISRHCHNLTEIRIFGRHSADRSVRAMSKFIEDLTSHPSWNHPTKNRKLHIGVEKGLKIDQISLERYGGRVELVYM